MIFFDWETNPVINVEWLLSQGLVRVRVLINCDNKRPSYAWIVWWNCKLWFRFLVNWENLWGLKLIANTYKSTGGRYVDTSVWIPNQVVGLNGKLSHQNTHNYRVIHPVTKVEKSQSNARIPVFPCGRFPPVDTSTCLGKQGLSWLCALPHLVCLSDCCRCNLRMEVVCELQCGLLLINMVMVPMSTSVSWLRSFLPPPARPSRLPNMLICPYLVGQSGSTCD